MLDFINFQSLKVDKNKLTQQGTADILSISSSISTKAKSCWAFFFNEGYH